MAVFRIFHYCNVHTAAIKMRVDDGRNEFAVSDFRNDWKTFSVKKSGRDLFARRARVIIVAPVPAGTY